jgi:hypothetical protein
MMTERETFLMEFERGREGRRRRSTASIPDTRFEAEGEGDIDDLHVIQTDAARQLVVVVKGKLLLKLTLGFAKLESLDCGMRHARFALNQWECVVSRYSLILPVLILGKGHELTASPHLLFLVFLVDVYTANR